MNIRPLPVMTFGNTSPTREDVDTAKLKKLAETIQIKLRAGLIEFKGALVKERAEDADLAKLVVRDSQGGPERVYLISRFEERSGPEVDGVPFFSRQFYLLVMFDPLKGYGQPQRYLRLMDGPGNLDEVEYCDFTVPPGQDPIRVKSQKNEAVSPMRQLMKEMERRGMFNPNPAIQNELEGVDLDF